VKYIYLGGAVTSVAFKTGDSGKKVEDVVLFPRKEYVLPDDNGHVQRLVNKGVLEKLSPSGTQTASKAENTFNVEGGK